MSNHIAAASTLEKDTTKNGATSNTSLEFVHFCTGLVDVEGTDDDEAGVGGEVTDGNRDVFDDVFVDCVDVVLELGGNGDDGGVLSHGSYREYL